METNLENALNVKRITVAAIARNAGVSRNTVYAVQRDPYRSTLDTLRRVLGAMGYEIGITITKKEISE